MRAPDLRHLAALMLAPGILMTLGADSAPALDALGSCLESQDLVRVVRVVGPDGAPTYARVAAHEDGVPTAVVPIVAAAAHAHSHIDHIDRIDARTGISSGIADVFERATAVGTGHGSGLWPIAERDRTSRICAPFALPQHAIDAETHVVVAAGLNYAAHAEEAGGGDVFLFPKPVAPGAPFAEVTAPAGVNLLDYEVELGFLLLEDVDLRALPSRDALLARSAFFLANDVTDREPIVLNATLSGVGTGFVEAKGQPGFMPAGPWMVRGSELFSALEACGEDGLGLRLEVDEGEGFQTRQDATTAAMILDPLALLERLADEVAEHGVRSPMPVGRSDGIRYYPIAVAGPGDSLGLPAGSVVLTGTAEGVAMQAPNAAGVFFRGLLHLRGPFEQFRREELARAAAGEPGGYLTPGDRVRASIDGLGTQLFPIGHPGTPLAPDPCGDRQR